MTQPRRGARSRNLLVVPAALSLLAALSPAGTTVLRRIDLLPDLIAPAGAQIGFDSFAQSLATGPASADADGDGVPDETDNCPSLSNPGQEDWDLDGAGDPCDCVPDNPGTGNCDDGNVCTDDNCDPSTGCSHANNTAACDDGDACTAQGNEACTNGFCLPPPEQAAVSTSWTHTCAVRVDGRLNCWGASNWGQVSGPNGSTDSYTAISAGATHTCALRTDRRLACWGNNADGRVSGPNGSIDTYTAVSAGDTHTYALRTDGRLACWGNNADGRVSGPNGSIDTYTAVSAGYNHPCALRTDGRLACWGWDGDGRVSGPNGSTDSYTAVSAGYDHTCALRTDGRLACWGSNGNGQVAGPNGSTDIYTAISAGVFHTCALRIDGRLACWGANDSGPNSSTDRYLAVSAGYNYTCALRTDWRLACWGNDYYGQVSGPNSSINFYGLGLLNCDDGNPCTIDSCNAAMGCVHVPGNGGALCRPAAGTCDVAERCTGVDAACPGDAAGNVGALCRPAAGPCDVAETCTGMATACPPDAVKPANTECPSDGQTCTLDICDGTQTSCTHPAGNAGAACRASAGVCDFAESCDGFSPTCPADALMPPTTECRPATGQCGDTPENCTGIDLLCPPNQQNVPNGTACDDGNPCTVSEICTYGSCELPPKQAAISAGDWHTCAVRMDGRLRCWGSDASGSDARGFVSGPNEDTDRYIAVSAGGPHTCALRTDGQLRCWNSGGSVDVDGPDADADGYTAVSAGGSHICAVRTDRRLACWGDDSGGKVSGPNGSTDSYTAVSAGNTHTCALRTDGRLGCWGDNGSGQVAGPNASTDSFSAVSAGNTHTCALRTDGRLRCWGSDGGGRVAGPNASTDAYTAVSAGSSHTCALRSDGHPACWGEQTRCYEDWVFSFCNYDNRVSGPSGSSEVFVAVAAGGTTSCVLRADGRLICWGSEELSCVYGWCPDPCGVWGCSACGWRCTSNDRVSGPNGNADFFGPPPPCDDENPCTNDSCDPAQGCLHDPGNGGTVCRPEAGACDVAEICTGTDAACPPDVLAPPTMVCRPAVGSCDAVELCDGTSLDCPADVLLPAKTVCRPETGQCGDTAESCTGFDTFCPVNQPNVPDGTPCDDGNACTAPGNETCTSGYCLPPEQAVVSAGFSHNTCALRSDGRLACWGWDGYGQVSGPNGSAESYTAVSVGAYHTCALRTDGRLACWGNDGDGQVSGPNGSTDSFTAVSAGRFHTCALRTDGRLACWGYDEGQVTGPNGSTQFYGLHQLNCDDASICTDDACDPASGCVHTVSAWAACDDANACTVDACDPMSGCAHTPVGAGFCDDGNPCTDDACDPASGCVHAPNVAPCSDGDACTQTDVCAGGACVGASPVVCNTLDQCHLPGVCDPGTGLCTNPSQPDGTVCTDGDWCTAGDACRSGICTPAFSGLDEPNPRTNGYYKRLCHGPHSGDQLTDADAACVAQVADTFAGISTAAQICAVIEPSQPNNDRCDQAEDDLMVLALNLCRARVCAAQPIDSRCGSNGSVGQSLAESNSILGSPARDFDTCGRAKCLDEEINTGRALGLNTLTLGLEDGGVRLTWAPPYVTVGESVPSRYRVWRRPIGSLAPFTAIGETTTSSFMDTTAGSESWEYEITAVMR